MPRARHMRAIYANGINFGMRNLKIKRVMLLRKKVLPSLLITYIIREDGRRLLFRAHWGD